MLITLFQLVMAAIRKFWSAEVMPHKNDQPLAPIRLIGDPKEIYLA